MIRITFDPTALAIAYFYLQQYKDVVDAARDAIDYNLSFSISRAVLAAALLRSGRTVDAKAAAREVLQYEPTFTIRGLSLSAGFEPAVFEPFANVWRELGLPE